MCGLFLTVKFSCLFTAVAVLACLRSLIFRAGERWGRLREVGKGARGGEGCERWRRGWSVVGLKCPAETHQSHKSVLHVLVFNILTGGDTVRDIKMDELLRKVNSLE